MCICGSLCPEFLRPGCGGKGAYRIAHALDFAAARSDPKPLIGYSDITILHLALWQQGCLPGFHGPYVGWDEKYYGNEAALHLRRAIMEPETLIVHQDPSEITANVLVEGTTSGILIGGNLGMIGMAVGWACPRFAGAILLIEAIDTFIDADACDLYIWTLDTALAYWFYLFSTCGIDGALTQLRRSGCLDGVEGRGTGPIHPLGRAQARQVVYRRCAVRSSCRTGLCQCSAGSRLDTVHIR
jgi:LD-carboxypeptidase N-terminal domain/LD-carboxypeptidase C-terminal domain